MSRFITYLALPELYSITPGALELAFQASDARKLVDVRSLNGPQFGNNDEGAPHAGDGFVLTADKDPISVLFVDAPLPRDAWERAVHLDLAWPQAKSVMEQSKAHIIIAGLRSKETHDDAFNQALAITLIASTISGLLPVSAAVFADAQRIASPDALQKGSIDLLNKRIPTELWSAIQFFKDGNGEHQRVGALTYGLVPFVGREIEWQPMSMDVTAVAQRVLGLCQYLIVNGPVINDGATVGLTETEKVRVRHAPQGRRPGIPILEMSA